MTDIALSTPPADGAPAEWAAAAWADDDLVAVAKPPGIATHRTTPDGKPGAVELLEATFGSLGVHQRLDAATSGVLVFARSSEGNRILRAAFAERRATKRYLAICPGPVDAQTIDLALGEFASSGRVEVERAGRGGRGGMSRGKPARTRVRALGGAGPWHLVEAIPETGRTHQIRAHLATIGAPILGDVLYGGGRSERMWLHAVGLSLRPGGPSFSAVPPAALAVGTTPTTRLEALLEASLAALSDDAVARLGTPTQTGLPAIKLDRYDQVVVVRRYLTERGERWDDDSLDALGAAIQRRFGVQSVVVKVHGRHGPKHSTPADRLVAGEPPESEQIVDEDGVRLSVSVSDGLGARLYLDQRANRLLARARLREAETGRQGTGRQGTGRQGTGRQGTSRQGDSRHEGAGDAEATPTMLNLFAYTCAFSAAAAVAGAKTTSVDISRKALDLGRQNLRLNGVDPGQHRFFSDDALDALARLERRGEDFDLVVCDPPAFARRGKRSFSVERDLDALVRSCLAVVRPGGWALISINHRGVSLRDIRSAVDRAAGQGIRIATLDLEVTEDGHAPLGVGTDLKSVWVRRA